MYFLEALLKTNNFGDFKEFMETYKLDLFLSMQDDLLRPLLDIFNYFLDTWEHSDQKIAQNLSEKSFCLP